MYYICGFLLAFISMAQNGIGFLKWDVVNIKVRKTLFFH